MNLEELILRYYPLFRKNIVFLALFVLGLGLLSYGLISSLSSNSNNSVGVVFESAAPKTSPKIFVDIEGSVIKPGVYGLPADSRVKDALVLAGGLSSKADRNYVAKNINLSQKLSDGVKIYIPQLGENIPNQSNSSNSGTGSITLEAKININTATLNDLDTLSGIGPVTGQKIIDGRPYNAIEDLTSKKIVTQKVFDKIKERITAY